MFLLLVFGCVQHPRYKEDDVGAGGAEGSVAKCSASGHDEEAKVCRAYSYVLIASDVESVADLGGIDASKLSKGVKPDEVQMAWLKRYLML